MFRRYSILWAGSLCVLWPGFVLWARNGGEDEADCSTFTSWLLRLKPGGARGQFSRGSQISQTNAMEACCVPSPLFSTLSGVMLRLTPHHTKDKQEEVANWLQKHARQKCTHKLTQGSPGGSVIKHQPANAGSGRSLGEGNGYPFHYSCLGNFMDSGAQWATVCGVAKESDTTEGLNNNNRHDLVKQLFSN